MLFHIKKQQDNFLNELGSTRLKFEKELLQTQLDTQEETFQHVSLELHDNVSHFLSLAKLHLSTMNEIICNEAAEKLETITLLISRSLEEVRYISKGFNSENIRNNGLILTVEQQIELIRKSGQFDIQFSVTGKTCYLEDNKEIVLFRIMQESLNNIIKHSRASIIQVELHFDEQKLRLSIYDNGVGFNVDYLIQHKHHNASGLKNIIKRSSLINAEHEILSCPGAGTTINITTPY